MSIDSLLPEQIEINTSGQYVLYCRHYPDTPEAACSICSTQDNSRYEPVGAPFGLPSSFEPASNYGLSGPGEARALFPGLVERERPAHEAHGWPSHSHTERYSTLRDDWTKPIFKEHTFLK